MMLGSALETASQGDTGRILSALNLQRYGVLAPILPRFAAGVKAAHQIYLS